MSGTTSTCSGLSCLNLNELFNFVKNLKDLDLYGYANAKKCCEDGSTVGANCNCPDDDADKAHADLCMFDYCLSWTDLKMKLNAVNDVYNMDQLAPTIAATLGGALLHFGRPTNDNFDKRLPVFWRNTAEVLQITSGFLAATYAGYATVQAAVKTEYWNAADPTYVGANFLAYGGVSWVGDLLGLFEVIWVILYLLLAAGIASAGLETAMMYNAAWDDDLTGVDAQNQEFHYLVFAFLLSLGGWLSAVALQKSATRLVGFFDIQNTDGVAVYESVFGAGSAKTDNASWLAVDVFHHTLAVTFYYLIAVALIAMPHELIKYAMDPNSVELPKFEM